ncbi:MAG: dTMP kinase [Verrucomicrobia bacterium]|nr:dTMP kinase [Verrucomicrobiota bacterium]
MFITFEGGEGAGKTTLIDRLHTFLQKEGKSVLLTRAPGGTEVGALIRDILLRHEPLSSRTELFLFLADRSEHVAQIIRPALANGAIVLCDRFNDSSVAYQGVGRGFGEQWVAELCAFACDGLQPDLTFYLDLDPKIGLQRVQRTKDRIEGEKLAFHQKIRAAYLTIAKKEPARFHVLDATKTPEEVFEEACSHILSVIH